MNTIRKQIAEAIKILRFKNDLTQGELADVYNDFAPKSLKTNTMALSRYECCAACMPGDKLLKLFLLADKLENRMKEMEKKEANSDHIRNSIISALPKIGTRGRVLSRGPVDVEETIDD